MPRPATILRFLHRLATLLSALALLVTLAAWIRGYYCYDVFHLGRYKSGDAYELEIYSGGRQLGLYYQYRWSEGLRRRYGDFEPFQWSYSHSGGPPSSVEEVLYPMHFWCGSRSPRSGQFVHAGIRLCWAYTDIYLTSSDPSYPGHSNHYFLILPCYLAALIFALLPTHYLVVKVRHRRRFRRQRLSLAPRCPACGYDLRATPNPAGPQLPRCPECGRPVAARRCNRDNAPPCARCRDSSWPF